MRAATPSSRRERAGFGASASSRLVRAIFVVVFSLSLAGCATFVGRAKRAYNQGRYLEVSEDLGRREEDLPYLSPSSQLEYGLYRGLALMNLGDAIGARRWLAYVNQVEKDNPGTMKPDHRALLAKGLGELGAAHQAEAAAPVPPPPPPSE
jgi:hypothetical protein